jgi:hypothetical protein
MRTGRHRYVTAVAVVVASGDGQLAAGVPRKLASPIAPIDSVPNRVCVDDCPDAAPIAGVPGLRPTIIGHDHPIDT